MPRLTKKALPKVSQANLAVSVTTMLSYKYLNHFLTNKADYFKGSPKKTCFFETAMNSKFVTDIVRKELEGSPLAK